MLVNDHGYFPEPHVQCYMMLESVCESAKKKSGTVTNNNSFLKFYVSYFCSEECGISLHGIMLYFCVFARKFGDYRI